MPRTTRSLVLTVLAVWSAAIPGCRSSAISPSQHALRRAPWRPVPGRPVLLPSRSTPPVETLPAPPETPPAAATDNPWKPEAAARDWKYIVLHHTATSRGSVESIHRTHLRRRDSNGNNWLGIGYHFVIGNGNGMGDGQVEPTFRWREQLHGAHAGRAEYNDRGIGIALVGNFDEAPPTEAQLAAVRQLVAILKSEYEISSGNVIGHSDVKATSCPGSYFPLAEIAQAFTGRTLATRRAIRSSRRPGQGSAESRRTGPTTTLTEHPQQADLQPVIQISRQPQRSRTR